MKRASMKLFFHWSVLLVALALVACSEEPSDGAGAGGLAGVAGGGSGGVGGAGVGGGAGMVMGGAGGAGMGGAGGAGAGGMGGVGGGGAGGMGATGPTYAPTFSAIYKEVLTNGMTGNCSAGFCHGAAPSPTGNGNLLITFADKQGAYDGLVNHVSTGGTMCEGRTLVVPGDSANSLVIQKLSATPPCGLRMPIGVPLSDAHVAQITQWIDLGAPND